MRSRPGPAVTFCRSPLTIIRFRFPTSVSGASGEPMFIERLTTLCCGLWVRCGREGPTVRRERGEPRRTGTSSRFAGSSEPVQKASCLIQTQSGDSGQTNDADSVCIGVHLDSSAAAASIALRPGVVLACLPSAASARCCILTSLIDRPGWASVASRSSAARCTDRTR